MAEHPGTRHCHIRRHYFCLPPATIYEEAEITHDHAIRRCMDSTQKLIGKTIKNRIGEHEKSF